MGDPGTSHIRAQRRAATTHSKARCSMDGEPASPSKRRRDLSSQPKPAKFIGMQRANRSPRKNAAARWRLVEWWLRRHRAGCDGVSDWPFNDPSDNDADFD